MCLACNFMGVKTKCCSKCSVRKVCPHACNGMNSKINGKIVKQQGDKCNNSENINYDIMCPFYKKIKHGENCELNEKVQDMIDDIESKLEAIDIIMDEE